MTNVVRLLVGVMRQVHRFRRDNGGSMAIMMGLTAVPLIFAVGAGIDYGTANMAKAKLDAVADAAALSAVDHQAITGTPAAAQTTAQTTFNAEAVDVPNVTVGNVAATVTDSTTGRTAVVNYTATKANLFMGIFGDPTTTLTGSSTAQAGLTTNINFYLLLDNSPSMNIAATSAGIQTMVNNTSAQGGCAFACHESNPSSDNLGNPGGEDNYTLAKNLGVVTRIQNLASATQSLMSSAASMEGSNQQYQMAIYTFNNSSLSTIQALTSNLGNPKTAAANINVEEVYSNNWLTKTSQNNDTDTNFETAMSAINTIMPSPGTGTPASTPQEVLFIVSDGVDDEVASSCSQTLDGNRCQQPFDTTWCTTIKNRGIQIAVLYTAYLPLPTNSWYNEWVAPFQNQISPNMESCASTGMFFSVTTDGDITAAMQTLF
ncbi:MAG: pilus assembly protein TadG-related protein, partial [Xanthobacteraceae bacterium]